jgi:hypothetical protein
MAWIYQANHLTTQLVADALLYVQMAVFQLVKELGP